MGVESVRTNSKATCYCDMLTVIYRMSCRCKECTKLMIMILKVLFDRSVCKSIVLT